MACTIQEKLADGSSHNGAVASKPIQYMETVEAYNKWAKVYDTDGSFLQALDTIEMRHLLPLFLQLLTRVSGSDTTKLIDLGCGTGRNTLLLAEVAAPEMKIIGLDASPGMLDVAREAIHRAALNSNESLTDRVSLGIFDLLHRPLEVPANSLGAAGVISTLVLEHIPLQQFFESATMLLRPGGYLLVTNMHSDMGAISQAGFVDTVTGTKIRPTSFSHTLKDVVAAADQAGFQMEKLGGQSAWERTVDETLAGLLGQRAKKWTGVTVWFGICFKKRFE
ncbi:S-adenosyl-L-methionine-dependent methyltransferase [Aspergillus ellipticus CBS 707.79]|uniref:S-adenosyl-L-methionine-dependent methyltransferase n=1 Tax=Aspergillus ellipticus CBS 707.79 TaxID=1448320 RepID=A0A319E7N0_9EURO|nr:S-adenosyl-L-methionine-dependent methyltransferase [Aspergillus ellipticus CBS 707.79]